MMTPSRPPILAIALAWCLSLALALGGAVDVSAAVLCIGFDGHVDVEYLLAGCCLSNQPSPDQPAVGTLASGAPDCGACVDLQVDDPTLRCEKQPIPAPEAGAANNCSQGHVNWSQKCRPFLADRFDHQSEALSPLSTIVLLI